MDIKVLDNLTAAPYERRKYCVIGTHNDVFYSDEVVAIAIYSLINQKKKIRVVRTSNEEVLKECHVYITSGTREPENQVKESEIPCLNIEHIWYRFGKNLIYNYMSKYFPKAHCFVNDIFEKFTDEVISFLEANEIEQNNHCFGYISSFLPSWNDSTPDFEGQFLKVFEITLEVFKQELSKTIENFMADQLIRSRLKNSIYFENNILEIPSQTTPWVETVVSINQSIVDDKVINFVIYQHPDGDWVAECVPVSLENRQEKRMYFPKEWAGQTKEKLEELTAVEGASCDNSCSCVRAKTRYNIEQLCNKVLF